MALMQVSFFSEALGLSTQMNVILPQQTQGQIGMEGRAASGKTPVLYLLHGMSDDHSIWLRRTSIERYVADMGLAVVMPTTHLGWYTDMAHGNRYWEFVSEELPKICHSFFNGLSDRREDTFAAGLSMGGYGALKLGLCAAGKFAAVASLSGAVGVCSKYDHHDNDNGTFWTDIFGPADKMPGSENDLFTQAEVLKASGKPLPKIYQWCGTEDFLYDQNVKMRDHLQALGYDVTYEESPGDHQWKYWDEKIQTILKWLPLE